MALNSLFCADVPLSNYSLTSCVPLWRPLVASSCPLTPHASAAVHFQPCRKNPSSHWGFWFLLRFWETVGVCVRFVDCTWSSSPEDADSGFGRDAEVEVDVQESLTEEADAVSPIILSIFMKLGQTLPPPRPVFLALSLIFLYLKNKLLHFLLHFDAVNLLLFCTEFILTAIAFHIFFLSFDDPQNSFRNWR